MTITRHEPAGNASVWSHLQPVSREDSPVPLYYRLQATLRELVESDVLRPGEALPPETRLEEIFGVSRITVRRAIEGLAREGLVVARQGVGTFVRDRSEIDAPCLESFTEAALRRDDRPGARLLGFETVAGVEPARNSLELAADAPMFRVTRLRLLNDQPVYVSTAYLPTEDYPGLSAADLSEDGPEQSLYRLAERFGLTLHAGDEETCAVNAPAQVASLFELAPATPVIKKSCLLRDRRGKPVLYEEAVWGSAQRREVRWECNP